MKTNQPIYTISPTALINLVDTVGTLPAESGGILGGHRLTYQISEFSFDKLSRRTGSTYTPDVDFVNDLLKNDWAKRGISFMGFVHSHPGGFMSISGGDLSYLRRIFQAIPHIEELMMPIVRSYSPGGHCEIKPWVVKNCEGTPRVVDALLQISPCQRLNSEDSGLLMSPFDQELSENIRKGPVDLIEFGSIPGVSNLPFIEK